MDYIECERVEEYFGKQIFPTEVVAIKVNGQTLLSYIVTAEKSSPASRIYGREIGQYNGCVTVEFYKYMAKALKNKTGEVILQCHKYSKTGDVAVSAKVIVSEGAIALVDFFNPDEAGYNYDNVGFVFNKVQFEQEMRKVRYWAIKDIDFDESYEISEFFIRLVIEMLKNVNLEDDYGDEYCLWDRIVDDVQSGEDNFLNYQYIQMAAERIIKDLDDFELDAIYDRWGECEWYEDLASYEEAYSIQRRKIYNEIYTAVVREAEYYVPNNIDTYNDEESEEDYSQYV